MLLTVDVYQILVNAQTHHRIDNLATKKYLLRAKNVFVNQREKTGVKDK